MQNINYSQLLTNLISNNINEHKDAEKTFDYLEKNDFVRNFV